MKFDKSLRKIVNFSKNNFRYVRVFLQIIFKKVGIIFKMI